VDECKPLDAGGRHGGARRAGDGRNGGGAGLNPERSTLISLTMVFFSAP